MKRIRKSCQLERVDQVGLTVISSDLQAAFAPHTSPPIRPWLTEQRRCILIEWCSIFRLYSPLCYRAWAVKLYFRILSTSILILVNLWLKILKINDWVILAWNITSFSVTEFHQSHRCWFDDAEVDNIEGGSCIPCKKWYNRNCCVVNENVCFSLNSYSSLRMSPPCRRGNPTLLSPCAEE